MLDRARRPKRGKLAQRPELAVLVAGKLQLEWSPQQIAGWLKHTYPSDGSMHVSHEAIYRSLFIQAMEHSATTRAGSRLPLAITANACSERDEVNVAGRVIADTCFVDKDIEIPKC